MQCLEPASEIVGRDEIGEVLAQLVVRFVIEALDRCLLDRPVHAFDLAIRQRMSGFCQAMLDIEVGTGRFERMATKQDAIGPHGFDILRRPSVAGRISEMRAVVGQHGMDAVWNRSGEGAQEVTSNATCRFLVQLDECEFRRPVDRHEEIEAPHFGADFGDVDMKIADRISLELRALRLVAFGVGQAADPMALKTTMQ